MKKLFLSTMLLALTFAACKDDHNIDTEKPVIDLTIQDAFPLNGDTIYFDEPFTVKMLFTDNQELGSYSIDIHNNFDHHSHSTEENLLTTLDPVKTPINPYTLIQDYTIPANSKSYETNVQITIPAANAAGTAYDDGDYHFMVQLTDHEGWATNKGLSLKVLHRN